MILVLFLFMIYATIGWLWETPYVSFNEKKYINRGFLKGPYIPIYGLASITIMLSMNLFDDINENNIFIILAQIIYIGIVSAVWEYGTSWSLEKLFHTRWWDYSARKFNLNGRIALDYSILFGIGGYILWRFVNPLMENMYDSLSSTALLIILGLFYTLFAIDNAFTFKDMARLRKIILQFERLKEELQVKYEYRLDVVQDNLLLKKQDISEFFTTYKATIKKELLSLHGPKGSNIFESIQERLTKAHELINNSKNISRFFSKYPRARANHLNRLLGLITIKRKNK
ncbi:MAG: putative ABC transporter permease [Candidatus Izemoplasma sp.]